MSILTELLKRYGKDWVELNLKAFKFELFTNPDIVFDLADLWSVDNPFANLTMEEYMDTISPKEPCDADRMRTALEGPIRSIANDVAQGGILGEMLHSEIDKALEECSCDKEPSREELEKEVIYLKGELGWL